jgi:hypothetical protein
MLRNALDLIVIFFRHGLLVFPICIFMLVSNSSRRETPKNVKKISICVVKTFRHFTKSVFSVLNLIDKKSS